jgi:K+:H+ antiporter
MTPLRSWTGLQAAPVAPIGAHELLVLLLQLGVLLLVALVLGRVAVRLGMSAVVGELAAGVLLGPSLFAHIAPSWSGWLFPPGQQHLLDAVGQLGVLLLVGLAGMHIDLGLVRRKGLTAGWVSTGGLVIPLALGIGIGFLLPASLLASGTDRTVFALFMGVALCVSAIPVIAKILLELRMLHRNIGQLIISAAAVDDIAGWLLLSVVSGMAVHGLRTDRVALSIAAIAAVVLLTVLVGRPICRTVLSVADRSGEPGVSLAAVVILLLLSAVGTHALGLEPILGAFLTGILIGSSKRIDARWMTPLRTFVMAVLAPIFFATAGLRMDLTALARPAVLLSAVGVLAVAIVGKFAGAYLGARTGRLSHWEGLALGAGLNARGVIQVIVAIVGLRLGILNVEAYTVIILVAIVTSLMAPPVLRYAVGRLTVTSEEQERERVFAG